ncbi:hypothetical protein PoB_004644300 [Plakobranchus ocellatus]|uniref:Uncharacterized protein n=1 Tax=Plakobranchus ocellatus TaxID=259542 RepID=A0AAV4BL98_9GAST|nr:hypothetical protein PoB_004644300 [Plakobranchus ocellatus]
MPSLTTLCDKKHERIEIEPFQKTEPDKAISEDRIRRVFTSTKRRSTARYRSMFTQSRQSRYEAQAISLIKDFNTRTSETVDPIRLVTTDKTRLDF